LDEYTFDFFELGDEYNELMPATFLAANAGIA
jgi:hypothetical protein